MQRGPFVAAPHTLKAPPQLVAGSCAHAGARCWPNKSLWRGSRCRQLKIGLKPASERCHALLGSCQRCLALLQLSLLASSKLLPAGHEAAHLQGFSPVLRHSCGLLLKFPTQAMVELLAAHMLAWVYTVLSATVHVTRALLRAILGLPPAAQQLLALSQQGGGLCRTALLGSRSIGAAVRCLCLRRHRRLLALQPPLLLCQLLPQAHELRLGTAALVPGGLQRGLCLCPGLCHHSLRLTVGAGPHPALGLCQLSLGCRQTLLRGLNFSCPLLQGCLALLQVCQAGRLGRCRGLPLAQALPLLRQLSALCLQAALGQLGSLQVSLQGEGWGWGCLIIFFLLL